MTKSQKEETKYITIIVNNLEKELTDSKLDIMSKAFDTFSYRLKLDKIGLLRKGETMLGEYLYKLNVNNLEEVRDFLLKMCNDDAIAIPVLVVMIGAIVEYVILKRKELLEDEH